MSVAFPAGMFAQEATPTRVITLQYQKAHDGKAAEHVSRLRQYWKTLHEEQVKLGKVTSWKAYSVSWPNGASVEYDFVMMVDYPSFAHLEAPFSGIDARKIMGEEKVAHVTANPLVTSLRTDILTLRAATQNWTSANNRVLVLHYLKTLPGKLADYLTLQREHYLPMNEERIQAGGATAWAATQVRFPTGTASAYNCVSFNGYENLAQMEAEMPAAYREKWGGSKTVELNEKLPTLRSRVKGEIWRLVDQTMVAVAGKPGT